MLETDLAVVGAGPAGLAAATEAAQRGMRVVIFDENEAGGGQLFKQIHKFFGSSRHRAGVRGFKIAKDLLREAVDAGVSLRLGCNVFGLFDGNVLGVADGGECYGCRAGSIVVATGASENGFTFPGWTLPGVMGAGAAQTMVNIHRVLPGKRALIVGSGNVGLVVGFQLLQAGVEVSLLIEGLPHVGGYEVHAAKLRRHGVKILTSHTLKEVRGRNEVEVAIVVGVDGNWREIPGTEREIEVDTVCLAVGLSPLSELLWMAGAKHAYVHELGGWVAVHNRDMQTSLPGVYIAGDASGVEEACVALEEGRLAGIAAAEAGGFVNPGQAATIKGEILGQIGLLRAGPFGEQRRRGKGRLCHGLGTGGCCSGGNVTATSGSWGSATSSVPAERLRQGPVAVIECRESIPCDPCESACPVGAITLGGDVSRPPILDWAKCTGCGLCIPACPGHAIRVVSLSRADGMAVVEIPYELLPLPETGQRVITLGPSGEGLSEGRVVRVRKHSQWDGTVVVGLEVPRSAAMDVRSFRLGE